MSKVIDNIEDIATIDSKAVLTTTQTALDLKANIASPTFTGTVTATTFSGALSGNATTATNVAWSGITGKPTRTDWNTVGSISNVVGQLSWKNYGNSHTIFDASASTSPDGGAVNNTNAQIAWSGSYPTLMGWNGGNTYGVRVDSARVADNGTSTVSLSGNGYQKLSNGLIIQWGSTGVVNNDNYYNIYYPIAFPNACTSVVFNSQRAGDNTSEMYCSINLTTSSYVRVGITATNNIYGLYWIAMGY